MILDNEHFHPISRLYVKVCAYLFGRDAGYYYITSIILHFVNSVLVFYFTRLIGLSKSLAAVSSFLFATTAVHAHVPVWLSTSGVIISNMFIILSLISLMKFRQNNKSVFLIFSFLLHLCAVLSWTVGFEYPVLIFFLQLFIYQKESFKNSLVDSLKLSFIFFFNVIFVLYLRNIFASEELAAGSTFSDLYLQLENFNEHLMRVYGIVERGFLFSLTGAYLLEKKGLLAQRVLAYSLLIVFFAFLRPNLKDRRFKILIIFSFYSFLVLLLPSLARAAWKFDWFVSRDRYRYSVSAFFFINFAIFCSYLRLGVVRSFNKKIIYLILGSCFFALYLYSNFIKIRERNSYEYSHSMKYREERTLFLEELSKKIDTLPHGKLKIKDIPFNSFESRFAGWNALPSHVCYIYLGSERCNKVEFVNN